MVLQKTVKIVTILSITVINQKKTPLTELICYGNDYNNNTN